jgi:hypothetical protein
MAESAFKKLESTLARKKGVTNPRALAAKIGDEKIGKEEMATRSAESRRKNRDKRLHQRKRH